MIFINYSDFVHYFGTQIILVVIKQKHLDSIKTIEVTDKKIFKC